MQPIRRLRRDKPSRLDSDHFIDGVLLTCLFVLAMYALPIVYNIAVTWFINH